MDFGFLTEQFVVLVLAACLVVGYIIKTSFSFVPNKYIPAILAVVGAVINVLVGGVSVETIVYGAVMGLSSTGLHQAFKGFVEGKKSE